MNKEQIFASVDKHRQLILDAERYIWAHPETGYREWQTHKYLKEQYEALGYTVVEAGNIPGFYTDIDTGREGPTVLVLGEMDSLIVFDHPECNKETGAVHACGHNAQSAALLGIAAVLREPGALDTLCGKIRLCAVPAEEGIEVEYRKELKAEGIIGSITGKGEIIRRGWLEGVDLAFMVHTTSNPKDDYISINRGYNGCIVKNVTYKGVSSHAGGSPWAGVNALYAANVGMTAVNALRETFRDTDQIRVHPIITAGGAVVNAIPETVKLESYVRGANVAAIESANKKVNRALAASAAALGAAVTIDDELAYSPLDNDQGMIDAAFDAAALTIGAENVRLSQDREGGCTDMGDISLIVPSVHPHISGAIGGAHSNKYYITNPESACVKCAKFQIMMLYQLLENGAERGKKIMKEHIPAFASTKEYIEFVDSLSVERKAVIYNDDGSITLSYC